MTKAEEIYAKLKGAPDELAQEVLDFVLYLENAGHLPTKPTQSMREFDGCLKDSEAFKGDPLEIQRAIRAGWGRERE